MKRQVKIKGYYPTREGVSDKGKWVMTDVVVTFNEQLLNGDMIEQSLVVSTPNYLNEQAVKNAISTGKTFDMTVWFTAREYNGKGFNNVRGSLPRELTLEDKPL